MAKFPMYGLHLWLPRAHVEAPLFGSVLLAAILLKLAGFGIIKFIPLVLSCPAKTLAYFSLIGGAFVRVICLVEKDIKKLIAYSSVAHMRFVIAGCSIKRHIGAVGALLFMYRHGICSRGLFIGRYCIYENLGSRRIYFTYGIIAKIPLFRGIWGALCVLRISCPPSPNFFREVYCIISLMRCQERYIVPCRILCFLAAGYSLLMYRNRQYGQFSGIRVEASLQSKWFNIIVLLLIWYFVVI